MTPDEWPHMRSIARCVFPVLVGPRIARTGASERRVTAMNVAAPTGNARFLHPEIRRVLTLFCDHRRCVDENRALSDVWPQDGAHLVARHSEDGMEGRGPARPVVQRSSHGLASPACIHSR